MGGNIIQIGSNAPNAKFWQVSNEYKVITTIDKYGHRVVPTTDKNSKKKLIFLGDSFAYGQGVSDQNTIPNLTCKQLQYVNCVNLGFPGSGSIMHKDKLINYLSTLKSGKGKVIHLILASTSQNYSGNDITDTINTIRKSKGYKKIEADAISPSKVNVFLESGRKITQQINLLRLLRLYIGDHIKTLAFLFPQEEISIEILNLYGEIINMIGKISEDNGYEYIPILLSPLSEVAHKKVEKSRNDIQRFINYRLLTPEYPSKSNAINNIYYRLDGHFNKKGTKLTADYITQVVAPSLKIKPREYN